MYGRYVCIYRFYSENVRLCYIPQQHNTPITGGPYHLTDRVNFPCRRKPGNPKKTYDFRRQSVDTLFSHEHWVRVTLWNAPLGIEPAISEVKGEWFNHFTTKLKRANIWQTLTFLVNWSKLSLFINACASLPKYFCVPDLSSAV